MSNSALNVVPGVVSVPAAVGFVLSGQCAFQVALEAVFSLEIAALRTLVAPIGP